MKTNNEITTIDLKGAYLSQYYVDNAIQSVWENHENMDRINIVCDVWGLRRLKDMFFGNLVEGYFGGVMVLTGTHSIFGMLMSVRATRECEKGTMLFLDNDENVCGQIINYCITNYYKE